MQREITSACDIFEPNGEVMQAGWARTPVFNYNIAQSKTAGKHSEKDCYFIHNNTLSVFLSAENLGKEFSLKIAVADLKNGGILSDYIIKKHMLGRNTLESLYNDGEFYYSDKRAALKVEQDGEIRYLLCDFDGFGGIFEPLKLRLALKALGGDSLNEIAPFERNRKFFYLKSFAPCYSAEGIVSAGGREYRLLSTDARAYFDKTRFSKPRLHNYQRLSADCEMNGKRFSLCLASRVGDHRFGSENSYFVDGGLIKLGPIAVKGTPNRVDRPFFFRGEEDSLDLSFRPFTVNGEAMTAPMGNTTVIFGMLYGVINRPGGEKPLILDNTRAHMIFAKF